MKKFQLFFTAVCCFVTISRGMEEKAGQHHEVYDRMIDKLLTTQKSDLDKNIDRIAPEIRRELIDVISEKKKAIYRSIEAGKQEYNQLRMFENLDLINAALKESLGEKSIEQSTSEGTQYTQKELVAMLDALVNTDRSAVPAKVKTFTPELKKALIEVFENVLKPKLSHSSHPEVIRMLNKLNFISEYLNQ